MPHIGWAISDFITSTDSVSLKNMICIFGSADGLTIFLIFLHDQLLACHLFILLVSFCFDNIRRNILGC